MQALRKTAWKIGEKISAPTESSGKNSQCRAKPSDSLLWRGPRPRSGFEFGKLRLNQFLGFSNRLLGFGAFAETKAQEIVIDT